ncbi:GlsB/YeaQ/YmgE family stress response membrane protein [Enterococcus sp. BWM-S5]|uniref:GlsB/YeaQ/YmgE family stress response membrane protein n=1 Tax=Enterococcus larvae TaxID=2794352 RepID=A0ABS4CPI9_9ENTE|nr:GlsB/YeaQ/YmgE family stress response membrane protein [Enterococcus larvae]MBP1048098.1 GlsB/YeaQ/YmgE family stress response membrane protein [Enterococcus larvae]
MSWLWTLIVGAVIGSIAGSVTDRDKPQGCLFNIIAGLIGSSVGQALFGYWGPKLAGMAIVPSILGAAIVVIVVSFFFGRRN